MSLGLGKLTILVGAGLVGSVLAKEGGFSDISNMVSGAFKIVFRQLKQEEPGKSANKPPSDTLMAQVNNLRQELQLLASNRPLTIVTTSGSGDRKYGLIIIVAVVGYGYLWWKGWKLPDFMFATRRSLSDACNAIAKQLDSVYGAISVTKRQLSSRIDRVDSSLDEIEGITLETGKEVTELREGATRIEDDVKSFRCVVETLENKISRIEGKQDLTLGGVGNLYIQYRESQRRGESNQALPSNSSGLAIEAPPASPSSRTAALPPASPRESQSPSASNGSHKFQPSLQHVRSSSGLKEVGEASSSHEASNGTKSEESASNGSSTPGAGVLWRFASPLMRTRSVTSTVAQPTGSSRPQ